MFRLLLCSVVCLFSANSFADSFESGDEVLLPPGSWIETCEVVDWNGRLLVASCHTGSSDPADRIVSEIYPSHCEGEAVENIWGNLRCEFQELPVGIRSLAYGGTGCPEAEVALESGSLSIVPSAMEIKAGPGVPASAGRKFCQLSLEVNLPSGYAYTLVPAHLAGSAHLDEGVEATITQLVYFDATSELTLSDLVKGPVDSEFVIDSTSNERLWSTCGSSKAANVKVTANIRAPRETSGIVRVADGMKFDLLLKACDQ